MEHPEEYTLQEVATRLSTSRYVLSRFCNSGLIPHVRRNRRGYRVLTPEQIDLADILLKMKQADFTKSELKRYARLYRQGDAAAAERLAILTTKKHQIHNEIRRCQSIIDFIERQEELQNEGSHATN